MIHKNERMLNILVSFVSKQSLTLFCVGWSSHLAATFLALSTRAAVLLATVLANPRSTSCLSLNNIQITAMCKQI